MKFSTLGAVLGAALALMCAGAASAQTLYGARGGSTAGNLYTINPATGVATVVGPIGYAVTGMAYNPTTSTMYGSTSSNSPVCSSCLITINLATGAGTLVGAMGLANSAADIAWSGTTLYGWSEDGDDLVTINTTTGVATVVGEAGLGTAGDAMDFSGGVLYAILQGNGNPLYTVNTTTGLPTPGPVVSGITGTPNSGSNQPGTNVFFVGSNNGNLYTLDRTTGVSTLIGATGIPNFDAIAFTAPPPNTVPTLSEWAMILFGGLLAMAGVLWVQRRRFGLA